jgi:hypothetical protein
MGNNGVLIYQLKLSPGLNIAEPSDERVPTHAELVHHLNLKNG